jgi:hypothetical protein
MRHLICAALIAVLPNVAFARGLALDLTRRTEFTDCASGGSSAQALVRDTDYLLRVTDADVWLCLTASGSTCATGGERFPVGTVLHLSITGDQVSASCRSSTSTGDATFTRVQ